MGPWCSHHEAAMDGCGESCLSDIKTGRTHKHKRGELGPVVPGSSDLHGPCVAGLPFLSSPGLKRLAEESGLASGKLQFPSQTTVRIWGFTMGGGACGDYENLQLGRNQS